MHPTAAAPPYPMPDLLRQSRVDYALSDMVKRQGWPARAGFRINLNQRACAAYRSRPSIATRGNSGSVSPAPPSPNPIPPIRGSHAAIIAVDMGTVCLVASAMHTYYYDWRR